LSSAAPVAFEDEITIRLPARTSTSPYSVPRPTRRRSAGSSSTHSPRPSTPNRRSPTVAELAAHLGVGEDEVLEGLESAGAYSTLSLDVPEQGGPDAASVGGSIGIDDEGLQGVEHREALRPLLSKLPPRERQILLLLFFGELTQSQIAERVGISQMHVSRLLAKTLTQLWTELLED